MGLELRANPHPEVYSQQGLFRSPMARERLPPLSARFGALSPGKYFYEAVVLPHLAGRVWSCPVPSAPSTLDAGRRSTTAPCRASRLGHPNVHREVAVWAAKCHVLARRSCIRGQDICARISTSLDAGSRRRTITSWLRLHCFFVAKAATPPRQRRPVVVGAKPLLPTRVKTNLKAAC